MNIEDIKSRVELLKQRHKHQHSVVDALVAEKAPDFAIQNAKIAKLGLKDEITSLEALLSVEAK